MVSQGKCATIWYSLKKDNDGERESLWDKRVGKVLPVCVLAEESFSISERSMAAVGVLYTRCECLALTGPGYRVVASVTNEDWKY